MNDTRRGTLDEPLGAGGCVTVSMLPISEDDKGAKERVRDFWLPDDEVIPAGTKVFAQRDERTAAWYVTGADYQW